MSKQFLEGQSLTRKESESKIRTIFKTEDIFIVGQGFNINFNIPHTQQLFEDGAFVTEDQIDAIRQINWKLTQVSSHAKGLHVWIKEVMHYE